MRVNEQGPMAYSGAYRDSSGRVRPIHERTGGRQRGHRTTAPSSGIKHLGALSKFGYREDESENARRRALARSVSKDGYKETVLRVNDLAVLNKGDSMKHERLESDLKWLRETYRE